MQRRGREGGRERERERGRETFQNVCLISDFKLSMTDCSSLMVHVVQFPFPFISPWNEKLFCLLLCCQNTCSTSFHVKVPTFFWMEFLFNVIETTLQIKLTVSSGASSWLTDLSNDYSWKPSEIWAVKANQVIWRCHLSIWEILMDLTIYSPFTDHIIKALSGSIPLPRPHLNSLDFDLDLHHTQSPNEVWLIQELSSMRSMEMLNALSHIVKQVKTFLDLHWNLMGSFLTWRITSFHQVSW